MRTIFKILLSLVLITGLVMPASSVQAATNNITVTPTSADWAFLVETAGTNSGAFVSGPATPPAGAGSLRLTVDSAAGLAFITQKYAGTLLADIDALSYSTYVTQGSGFTAPTFQIHYDPDLTAVVDPKPWYGRLVYEPYMNGTITNGTWQTWDMLAGEWWASGNANSTVDDACPQSNPCTLTELLTAFPNIGIRGNANAFILFKAGGAWTGGFDGNVDNLTVEIGGDTDIYDFEPLATVYVDDNWVGTTPGDDPDGAGPATSFGADSFATIQEGIDAVADNGTVYVYDGTYVEELLIDKPLSLLGPNEAINPNTGVRVAEAIIHPVNIGTYPIPDTNADCTVLAYLATSDITIRGFTFDGDNPNLTSGVMIGTADVDACEILAGYEGMGGIVVENNILKHSTYSGIDFYNYYNNAATSDNYIRYNLFENIGETTSSYGIGILVYNNFYADIADNVFDNIRTGIQTGNFYRANVGPTGSISNNTINVWRLGIFHNLWYSDASTIPVSGNTINAIDSAGTPSWNGMLISSWQGAANTLVENNIINIGDITQLASGYNVWNTPTTADLTISGGTVTGGDYGVFVNNFDGYNSNASNTSIKVDGVTITDAAMAGVYVKDNPSNSNSATVFANIQNSIITNSGTGILVEGSDATAVANFNDIYNNATAGVTNTSSNIMDAENNWWGTNNGPEDLAGTVELPVDPEPAVGDMLNADPTGLLGNSVSENVDYYPWTVTTKATLDVTADNQVKFTDEPDLQEADFTFKYSGFVDDDGEGDIDTPPTCNVTGNQGVPGLLDIVCSGGADDNYDFNYINGTLTVSAANNEPTDISLSNNAVDENAASGTTVGQLSTTDDDVTDTFTYTLVNGGVSCPGTDNASFQIDGDLLKTNAVFDFETKDTYVICVETDDDRGGTFEKEFIITVNDIEELFSETTTFRSQAKNDGWVLESARGSKKGGSKNNTAKTLRLGDTADNRQYRSILSFNTASLPDDANITSVILKVKRQTGVITLRGIMVDIRKGTFGKATLQLSDFNAKAHQTLGSFSPPAVGNWYTINLTPAASNINTSGLTQIRLRFRQTYSNNDIANILTLLSGNSTLSNRPQLVIEYEP